jgi:surface antigen
MEKLGVGVMVCALALVGCEGIQSAAQSKTVQGAALGSALGTGTGAIIGNQTGKTGAGTAIGAGLGAVAGGLVGSNLEAQDRKYQAQQYPPAAAQPPASGQVKFCPVGDETYANSFKYCPIHGAELRERTS